MPPTMKTIPKPSKDQSQDIHSQLTARYLCTLTNCRPVRRFGLDNELDAVDQGPRLAIAVANQHQPTSSRQPSRCHCIPCDQAIKCCAWVPSPTTENRHRIRSVSIYRSKWLQVYLNEHIEATHIHGTKDLTTVLKM